MRSGWGVREDWQLWDLASANICNFHQASRSSERGAPHHTVIDPHQLYLNSSLIKIWAGLERQHSQECVYLASMNLSLISRTPMKVNWGIVSPVLEKLRPAAQEIFSKPALNTGQVPASKRPYLQTKTNGWYVMNDSQGQGSPLASRAMGINWSYCSGHKQDKQNKTNNNL